jgi:hypothetical protein
MKPINMTPIIYFGNLIIHLGNRIIYFGNRIVYFGNLLLYTLIIKMDNTKQNFN